MYKINKFAEMFGISSKTLRFYDKVGIIRPKITNKGTGYRYYTIDQISTVSSVLLLKELGFSLAEIREFVNNEISREQKLEKLNSHQRALDQYIQNLKQFDKENNEKTSIKRETLNAKTVAYLKVSLSSPALLHDKTNDLMHKIAKSGLVVKMPINVCAIFDNEKNEITEIQVEIEDSSEVAISDFVKSVDDENVICSFHDGEFATLSNTIQNIQVFASQNNLALSDAFTIKIIEGFHRENDEPSYLYLVASATK